MNARDADAQVYAAWMRVRAKVIAAAQSEGGEAELRRAFCNELYQAAITPVQDAAHLARAAQRLGGKTADQLAALAAFAADNARKGI
jgi:hypothetical protein